MTGIETNFQLKAWKRQLARIAEELAEAAQAIPEGLRSDRMIEAYLSLNRVIDKLDLARSIPQDLEETPLLLQLSVQAVRESAVRDESARKRCETIGGGVPLKMENARSSKIERFRKPAILKSTGE